jgi:hypothetical protein
MLFMTPETTPQKKHRGRPPGIVETKKRYRLEFRYGDGPSKTAVLRLRKEALGWPVCACGCGEKLGSNDGKRKYVRGHGPTARIKNEIADLLSLASSKGIVPPDEGIVEKMRTSNRRGTYPKAVAEYVEFLQRVVQAGHPLSPIVVDIDELQQECRAFYDALEQVRGASLSLRDSSASSSLRSS